MPGAGILVAATMLADAGSLSEPVRCPIHGPFRREETEEHIVTRQFRLADA